MAVLKALRFPAVVVASAGAALFIGNIGAFAYASGSIGYDIGYLQCGTPYPNASTRLVTRQVAPSQSAWRFGSRRVTVRTPTALQQTSSVGGTWWSVPQQNAPTAAPSGLRTWFRPSFSFGIIGVDSGHPFMSPAYPGNPCLRDEYNHTPQAALYVNTGYDPSYTDPSHTTSSCSMQSAGITGSADQKAAWAVGCSEAQGDNGYAMAQGITSPTGWWLDVESANSWCGQHGVSCDLSLNQYTLQGIIDTFTHIGALPIGIYSNQGQWSAIVGNLPVIGATSDWVATGATTAQQAATYCASSYSFSGQPVSLVQFLGALIDRDYAC